MKKDLTEIVFIIDRSGSMSGLEKDTVGGFNGMLEKQRREAGEAFVTTVLFDHEHVVLHDRIPIGEVAPMTERDYYVRGCTALLDALGSTLAHIGNIHKYARKEDVPAHTVFVIITDGMENASKEYTAQDIKQMIGRRQSENGWEFLFLGANIDAVQTAESYGLPKENAVNYTSDAKGTRLNYEVVGEAVRCMRVTGELKKDWSAPIRKDHRSRKNK